MKMKLLIFNKTVETTFNGSPFKSLISYIRSILPKDGCKKLKKHLEYDEIKKLMLVITKKECSKYGIEYNELIENQYQKADGIIQHRKVEDTKMPKSSKSASDKIKEFGLTMEELKETARKIGVKN